MKVSCSTKEEVLSGSSAFASPRLMVTAAAIVASSLAFADGPVGPGAYEVSTSEDVSYVDSGFAVPANAAVTVRPGVFFPAAGLPDDDEVVWKNVKLTDIASFTGKISSGSVDSNSCRWEEAGCYNVVTNADEGYVQCQLQLVRGSTLYGAVMQYRQEGSDVKARIAQARYKSNESLGYDLSASGAHATVASTLYSSVAYGALAVADLGFVLRDGAETSAAPTEIVLSSTDTAQPDEETYSYFPCLTNEHVLIARNLRIGDIVGISGEISQMNYVKGGEWTEVQGYCLTNVDDAVQMNLMYKNGSRRIGANIRFYQDGTDVKACAFWGGHSYDNKELDEPFGSGIIGASLGVTNKQGTSAIAIRNLKVRFSPATRIVAYYGECIVTNQGENGWVKIWDGVSLGDATFGPATMGRTGKGADVTSWSVVSNYLRTAKTYTTQSYYQWLRGDTLFSIRFLMQQQFGDVYAKIASASYKYKDGGGYPVGTDPTESLNNVIVTNVADVFVDQNLNALIIKNLTADLPAKKWHTVTVGGDFNPGPSPVRLNNIKLALAPGNDEVMNFDAVLRGCGAVGVSGAGVVALDTDLPVNVGLDVDSGTAKITSSVSVGGKVNVKSGAKLEFQFAKGVRPSLAASSFTIEPGAEIVISAENRVSDIAADGETFKIVTGCKYDGYALEGVTCRATGNFVRVRDFFVDDDGDLAVTLTPSRGLIVIFR